MKAFVILLLCMTGMIQAQNVKVLRTDQLMSLKDGEFIASAVSPDGKNVLVSYPGFKGLFIIDIILKQIHEISDKPGAGYEPCFSADGSKIFFRSDEFVGLKKYSSLSEYDLNTGKTRMIENKSREMTSPVIINNHLIYSVEGKRKENVIGSNNLKSIANNTYVTLENLTPVLYINGNRKPIMPNGEGNYIWVSLSPDKTMLLYNFRGSNTYVTSLDGNILDDLGRLNAPKWLNNEMIVGMNDMDDGYRVLSSDIICYSLITKLKINLTSTPDKTEMYPLPFNDGNKIIYQTIKGELFIMYLSLK